MKIRHSIVHYILPAFFALICFMGGTEDVSESSSAMLCTGIGIVLLSLIDYLTSYIEVKNGMVKAHVGLIRRKSLSTPIGNINGCEIRKFLFWNRIKITSGLTLYVFKNMRNLDAFSRAMASQNCNK